MRAIDVCITALYVIWMIAAVYSNISNDEEVKEYRQGVFEIVCLVSLLYLMNGGYQ